MSATAAPAHLRALYRSFLRELPSRRFSGSPIQKRIRTAFASATPDSGEPAAQKATMAHAEQYLQYLKAQRMYATLVERYNPGMNMEEEERIKLTARVVGMELPVEYVAEEK